MFLWDPRYLIFALPALLLALYAQMRVKSTYASYSRKPNARGLTGYEAARILLRSLGMDQMLNNLPTDQTIVVSTDLPQNSGQDTRLHVFMGGCAGLSCVTADDDGGSGYLSTATFAANFLSTSNVLDASAKYPNRSLSICMSMEAP